MIHDRFHIERFRKLLTYATEQMHRNRYTFARKGVNLITDQNDIEVCRDRVNFFRKRARHESE